MNVYVSKEKVIFTFIIKDDIDNNRWEVTACVVDRDKELFLRGTELWMIGIQHYFFRENSLKFERHRVTLWLSKRGLMIKKSEKSMRMGPGTEFALYCKSCREVKVNKFKEGCKEDSKVVKSKENKSDGICIKIGGHNWNQLLQNPKQIILIE